MENNYRYTKFCATGLSARDARFVYASSAATYGDGANGMVDDEAKIESLRPLNAYGYSKQIFDHHAKRRALFSKIVGLKYFNVFGPNEWHKGEMRSLINKSYDQVLETGKIQLFKSYKPTFKDGEQKRDFLYVKDAVDMTIHLAVTRVRTASLISDPERRGHGRSRQRRFCSLSRPPRLSLSRCRR